MRLLRRSHRTLTALHGHEVLAGLLLDEDAEHVTAASAALRLLAELRDPTAATPTTSISSPSTRCCSACSRRPSATSHASPTPRLAARYPLPERQRGGGEGVVAAAGPWVQELTARAALALGRRLVDRGALDRATAVVDLRLDELASLVESGGSLAIDLRRAAEPGRRCPRRSA